MAIMKVVMEERAPDLSLESKMAFGLWSGGMKGKKSF